MANKISVTYSDMPRDPNKGNSKVEKVVVKITDMETAINEEIDALVDLKLDIIKSINSINEPELQRVLDLRYLKFLKWEEVSWEMGYSIKYVYHLHRKALNEINIPER